MSAVVSLRIEEGPPDPLTLIQAVGRELDVPVRQGGDGSWELSFQLGYPRAHAAVIAALDGITPDWSSLVTVEYALVA